MQCRTVVGGWVMGTRMDTKAALHLRPSPPDVVWQSHKFLNWSISQVLNPTNRGARSRCRCEYTIRPPNPTSHIDYEYDALTSHIADKVHHMASLRSCGIEAGGIRVPLPIIQYHRKTTKPKQQLISILFGS